LSAGFSPIPSLAVLDELKDEEFRDGFVADHVRTRLALLIRTLREQVGWSQAELGRRMGKPQSVVSRLEDPDYGRVSLQTIFEVAAAFKLPVYIDMPNWDDWFGLMEDMSARNLERRSFDADYLAALTNQPQIAISAEAPVHQTSDSNKGGAFVTQAIEATPGLAFNLSMSTSSVVPLASQVYTISTTAESSGSSGLVWSGQSNNLVPTMYQDPINAWYSLADRRMTNVG
jgi:transcriptional regulator with XRE-family HTH domain